MVGRWEMIGTFNTREEFIVSSGLYENDTVFKEIYFLPGGEWYWIFSWTKGFIKNSGGGGNKLIPYQLEEINGERFMFAEYKNEYGCKPLWVLKQTDHNAYTAYNIGQWDCIELPFIDDCNIHGKWTAVDFVVIFVLELKK